LPSYTTERSGLGHLLVFTCTVELAGITFTGDPAKNKKQAEKNAASAAWSALKQREYYLSLLLFYCLFIFICICNNLEKERSIATSLKMVSLWLGKIFLGQDMDIDHLTQFSLGAMQILLYEPWAIIFPSF